MPSVIAFLLVSSSVIASVIGITSTPVDLLLGDSINCVPNLTGNTDVIKSTSWSQRKIFATNQSTPWQDLGTNSQVTVYGEMPVTYEVKLVTTYGNIPGNPIPPATTTNTRSWTVASADGVRDVSGLNQDIPMNGLLDLVYWV